MRRNFKLASFPGLLSLFLLSTVLFSGCSEEQKPTQADPKKSLLYSELKEVYRVYLDSLSRCEDSVGVDSFIRRLDYRVRKTYEKYPADLDTKLSESENDTLWKYISRIVEIRSNLYKSKQDSIPADSILIAENGDNEEILKE